jgi:hypothetical protein
MAHRQRWGAHLGTAHAGMATIYRCGSGKGLDRVEIQGGRLRGDLPHRGLYCVCLVVASTLKGHRLGHLGLIIGTGRSPNRDGGTPRWGVPPYMY